MLTPKDYDDLCYARSLLSNPGLAARISSYFGGYVDKGVDRLPERVQAAVNKTAQKAIESATNIACATLDKKMVEKPASNRLHKVLVAASGAAGGSFGLPALALELPISTALMMRSIADIARSEGARLSDPLARVECVSVFALGGPSAGDDAAETGYYAVRLALARSVAEAAEYLAATGGARAGTPALARLVSAVSSRFGVQVSQKVAAQAVPLIGAAGGALVNTLFIAHYQDMARGHFIIKRLEAQYGMETVRLAYQGAEKDSTAHILPDSAAQT